MLSWPEAHKPQLMSKMQRYLDAEWCLDRVAEDTALMLCIKKDKQTTQTAIDPQNWNENPIWDVALFPDQDEIREMLVRGKYCSKPDMISLYKQIRVHPDSVSKTAFQTRFGKLYSKVMHHGDCNIPSTFQCLVMCL